jgi:hypothetical protein
MKRDELRPVYTEAQLLEYLHNQEERLRQTASAAMKAEVRKGIELARKELAKDHVTLKPVPVSGERELRYTVKDEKADTEIAQAFAEYMSKSNVQLKALCMRDNVKPLIPGVKQSMVDGLLRLKFGGDRYNKWAHTSRSRAKDSALSTGFLAALIAVLAWAYHRKETVGPQDYDLTSYQPRCKTW